MRKPDKRKPNKQSQLDQLKAARGHIYYLLTLIRRYSLTDVISDDDKEYVKNIEEIYREPTVIRYTVLVNGVPIEDEYGCSATDTITLDSIKPSDQTKQLVRELQLTVATAGEDADEEDYINDVLIGAAIHDILCQLMRNNTFDIPSLDSPYYMYTEQNVSLVLCNITTQVNK